MDRIDRAVASLQFSDERCYIDYISGVALGPDHGDEINDLLEKANIALEAITRIKRNKYLLFDQNINEEVSQYFRIKKEIDFAFEREEFTVVYQPQNDAISNKIIGLEALVRWNNQNLGSVPPSVFVPILEENPIQIKKLGKYILSRVVRECRELLEITNDDFRISVNLSSQEFTDFTIIKVTSPQ
ncbi:GGDEF domain-containing phosphodiesterase [Oceanispirochaeta crateris]|nr:GGDEF domain-containing phosphodiesterase [Oceanispirochaeta crateris]